MIKYKLTRNSVMLFTVFIMLVIFNVIINISSANNSINTTKNVIELTAEEKEYISENPVITIAMDTSWIPYAFKDRINNSVNGFIPNILNTVAERVGMKAQYVSKQSYIDAIHAVQSGETMLVSGIANDPAMSKKNDVLITAPYINIYYSAISKDEFNDLYVDGADYKVAVCVGSYSTMAMKKEMPSYEFIEYHSNEECMEAVKNGDADIALIATYAAEYYKSRHEFRSLKSVLINDFSWGLCFGVNKNVDPRLISILNKGIATLSVNDVNQAVYNGIVDASDSTERVTDWIYDRPLTAIGITALLFILILMIVSLLFIHHSNRRKLMAEQRVNQQLLDDKRRIELADKAKSDFFARMSHDMRTPMNGILGMIELTRQSSDMTEIHNNMLKAKSAGDYMLSLINDTLDLQRMESGKLQIEPQNVYACDFLDNMLEMVKASAEKKNIELIVKKINLKNCYINIDSVRVKQIFMNLLSNAIKFTPNDGTISITIECLKRDIKFSSMKIVINDTGVGMSKEFLEHGLFKVYSQEQNPLSNQYAGSGLGLAIVKNLVDIMNGRIEVKSELGEGTIFTVYLDLERVKDETAKNKVKIETEKNTQIKASLQGTRILVCEDHPLNAEIAKRLLEKVGCEVTWADNGKTGLTIFAESAINYFDIILMDIRMPIMGGLDSAKAIRALDRADAGTIPIIAMTANAYDSDIKQSYEAGMNEHLAKPIEAQKLYDAISKFIDK